MPMVDNGFMKAAWLVRKGEVLASVNVADSRGERRRGLIGVSDVHTPLVLRPCNWVHTVGMRAEIDVAYIAADGTVLETHRLRPMRVAPWNRKAETVVEAAAGSFERWNLTVGDCVEVRGA